MTRDLPQQRNSSVAQANGEFVPATTGLSTRSMSSRSSCSCFEWGTDETSTTGDPRG